MKNIQTKLKNIVLFISFGTMSGCGALFEGLSQDANFATYNGIHSQAENQFIGNDSVDGGLFADGSERSIDAPKIDEDGNTNNGQPQVTVDIPPVREPEILPESLEISMTPKSICQAGEVDAIRLSMHCYPNFPLILTRKDSTGETIIENFGSQVSNGQGGREEAIRKLRNSNWMSEITGYEFDLFLCLDSNGDNSCMDEQVMDLNQMNADLLLSILNFNKIDRSDKVEKRRNSLNQICSNEVMKKVENGLVFYHQSFLDSTQEDIISAARLNVHDLTADRMAEFVKNFNEDTEVMEFETGTSVTFSLVEANKNACDKIDKIIHGCYVSGTSIHISEENTMPIEELQVGYPVLRSNGSVTKVAKVVKGPEEKKVIKIKLASEETVTLTENHPVHTKTGLVLAKDLQEGQRLLNKKGEWQILTSLKKENYHGLVYNIELEGSSQEEDHLLYSGGIVTGDLFLQNKDKTEKNLALQK